MKRKQYTERFKRRAVQRVANGEGVGVVAKALKISDSMLYVWRKRMKVETEKEERTNGGARYVAHEGLILLRHAKDAVKEQVKLDPNRVDDPVYNLTMMALRKFERRMTK